MADEREFTTLPRRALGDRRLSGMDLRVLGAISLHDGLSLSKGKGQGCYAGDRKLAQTANTDRTNVKRSKARLLDYGYLFRDPDTLNRRGFVMRVIPDSMVDEVAGGEMTPSDRHAGNRLTAAVDQIGGEATSPQQGASSPPIGREVTPSAGGEMTPRIETEESLEENHKINSPEGAHIADRDERCEDVFGENVLEFPERPRLAEPEVEPEYVDPEMLKCITNGLIKRFGTARRVASMAGVREPYISRARYGDAIPWRDVHALVDLDRSIYARLPANFLGLDPTAQVPILERNLTDGVFQFAPEGERKEIASLLFSIADAFCDTPTGRQAQRLLRENLPCQGLADE